MVAPSLPSPNPLTLGKYTSEQSLQIGRPTCKWSIHFVFRRNYHYNPIIIISINIIIIHQNIIDFIIIMKYLVYIIIARLSLSPYYLSSFWRMPSLTQLPSSSSSHYYHQKITTITNHNHHYYHHDNNYNHQSSSLLSPW